MHTIEIKTTAEALAVRATRRILIGMLMALMGDEALWDALKTMEYEELNAWVANWLAEHPADWHDTAGRRELASAHYPADELAEDMERHLANALAIVAEHQAYAEDDRRRGAL